MFASKVTDTVTLSNGTDTVTVRKLGWKAQEAAQLELQRQAQVRLASLGSGFIEVQQAVRKGIEANGGIDAIAKAVAADPFLTYDKSTLLERGIVSWTLSEKPTTDQVEDLDPADAETIARAIYNLFRPKTEDERKNG
jgi:hypothetical protein